MRTPPEAFELLRRAVLGQVDPGAVRSARSRHGWPAILHAACWHGVENHLYLALRTLDPDRPELLPLESLYRRNVAAHMRAVADVARIAPGLEAQGIAALIVKGAVLAELYAQPDLRAYSDIDVVVRRAQFGAAVKALQNGGGRLLDRQWERIRSEARTQVHLEAPHGTSIDLHWHLLNRGIARRGLTVEMDALFEHSIPTSVTGVPCLTTDAVDTALHVAVHAGVSGGVRLSQVADVRAALTVADLDWDQLSARARSWGAGEMVAIMAARATRLLDMPPLPPATVRQLADRRGWSAVVTTIESRLRPELRSEYGPVARMTRAARPGRARSAATAAAWFAFQTRGWVTRRLPAAAGGTPAGSDDHRQEYFAAVADVGGRERRPPG